MSSSLENKEQEKLVVEMDDSQKKNSEHRMTGFKLLLLGLMVAQNSSTVLVGRYTRSNAPKEDLFIVSDLVLVTEFLKVSHHFHESRRRYPNVLRV
jgi:hypothetical protein